MSVILSIMQYEGPQDFIPELLALVSRMGIEPSSAA